MPHGGTREGRTMGGAGQREERTLARCQAHTHRHAAAGCKAHTARAAAPPRPTGANRRAWPFSSAPQLPVGAALDAQAFTLRNSRARTQRAHTRLHGLSYHLCRRSARAAGPFAAAVYPSGRSTANASPSGPATHSRTTDSGASPPSRALPRSQRSRVSPAGS